MLFIQPYGQWWCSYSVSLQALLNMAEGSKDQGGTGAAEPEEDSPNMIVYRKVGLCTLSSLQYITWCEKQSPNNLSFVSKSTNHAPVSHWGLRMSFLSAVLNQVPLFLFPLSSEPYSFFCVRFQAALQHFNNLPIPSVKGLGSEGSFHCQG